MYGESDIRLKRINTRIINAGGKGQTMNQWYRQTVTKAVMLIAGMLGGAAVVTALITAVMMAGTVNPAEIMRIVDEPYEDSGDFTAAVEDMMFQALNKLRLEAIFETDGAYNPDKIIDIMELSEKGEVSGENISGIAYSLSNLEDWADFFSDESNDIYEDNGVIVCQKTDGSYFYYYTAEFLDMFEKRKLTAEFEDEMQTLSSFLGELEKGNLTAPGNDGDVRIYDENGTLIYTDCWNFGSSVREKYAPAGSGSLLQAVNESPRLNGKLSLIYDKLTNTLAEISGLRQIYKSGWDYLEEGNTNFTYLYADQTARKVVTNKAEYSSYENIEKSLEDLKSDEDHKYLIVYPQLRDLQSNMQISSARIWDSVKSQETGRQNSHIFAAAVDISYPVKDQFYESKISYDENMPILKGAMIYITVGEMLFLLAIVWLGVTAGRKPGSDAIHLTAFDRWKTEPAFLFLAAVWACATILVLSSRWFTDSWYELKNYMAHLDGEFQSAGSGMYSVIVSGTLGLSDVAGLYLYCTFSFFCFFVGYISIIKRIKAKTVWKGSVLHSVLVFGGHVLQARSTTGRAGALTVILLALHWIAVPSDSALLQIFTLLADAAALWIVLKGALAKERIRTGIAEIASGNLEYRIRVSGLRGVDRDLAEKVNDIGNGLNRAVDEAMRNERLKTDLITNVSHDIKTPLTSIINYVDILKRSDIADEKIRGYLDILESKAQRLKTLTEDVVEASKVSSGNITLEYMDVDLRELVKQTEGEMTEKFAARSLSVVLNMPEEPALIHVDGRRMWRVLENIFGNAAKYAMPGTRVYADLVLTEESVRFSLKNISEQQLNISADELTERFIRGDISRSTEGSGLGLSIAKSLTAMQGGEFVLYLDGDLFKVDIEFPRMRHDNTKDSAEKKDGL